MHAKDTRRAGNPKRSLTKRTKKLLHKCEPPLPSMPALGGDRGCLPSVQVSLLWTPSSSTSPRAPRHFEIERKIINPPLYFFVSSLSIKVWSLTQHTPPTSRHTFYSALLQTLPHIRKQKPIQMYPKPGVHKLIRICSEEG